MWWFFQAGCKFLIFAHHLPMIDSIHQFLLVRPPKLYWILLSIDPFLWLLPNFQKKKVGCIRIDGSTPPASRQALVTDFQEKDSIKAAVVQFCFICCVNCFKLFSLIFSCMLEYLDSDAGAGILSLMWICNSSWTFIFLMSLCSYLSKPEVLG